MADDWKVVVIVKAPSGNTDAEYELAHGLDEDEAYTYADEIVEREGAT